MAEHPVHEFRPGKLTPHGCERCGKVKSDPVHRPPGGEHKYGRLFTEADVRSMLVEAACDAMDGPTDKPAHVIAEEVIAGSPATFPPDEPLFLLRARDRGAPDAIQQGSGTQLRAALERVCSEMRMWQFQHPDRVKVLD